VGLVRVGIEEAERRRRTGESGAREAFGTGLGLGGEGGEGSIMHLSRWELMAVSFMRREQMGQATRPSSGECQCLYP
jgi:hypothetical protein